jgi:hypothetical protein
MILRKSARGFRVWVDFQGARVCDPQQRDRIKTLKFVFHAIDVTKLLRVTDSRSDYRLSPLLFSPPTSDTNSVPNEQWSNANAR